MVQAYRRNRHTYIRVQTFLRYRSRRYRHNYGTGIRTLQAYVRYRHTYGSGIHTVQVCIRHRHAYGTVQAYIRYQRHAYSKDRHMVQTYWYVRYRHTYGIDIHMVQMYIWYRCTYGTDVHTVQTAREEDRQRCIYFFRMVWYIPNSDLSF
jgi:hypothetical protein